MKKKLTALILSFIMVFALVPQTSAYEKEETIRAKISPELAEVMEKADKDELIPIAIFREGLLKEINESILKETGKNPENYQSSVLYEKNVKAVVERAVETEYGKEKAHMADKETGMSPVLLALHKEADDYLEAKRTITSRIHTEYNNGFIAKYIEKDRKIVYTGTYTPTIITEGTIEEIMKIASLDEVNKIMFHEEIQYEPGMNQAANQIGATALKNNAYWTNYKGNGVSIGIIEFDDYETSNPHLINLPNLHYVPRYTNVQGSQDDKDHATLVTAEIVGKRIVRNNVGMEGIVPNADVYFTVTDGWDDDLLERIIILIYHGVNIINYSGCAPTTNNYSYLEREIDYIIYWSGVTFVTITGNYSNNNPGSPYGVMNPGRTLSAITVGNAVTKSSATAPISTTAYSMNTSNAGSCYISPSYMPNKPDISAPGTNIVMAIGSTSTALSNPIKGTGTSFAAPLVAGVAAQAMQRDPYLKHWPTGIKSWLILNADFNRISSTNNIVVPNTSSLLRERSGAGFLNAQKIDDGYNYWSGTIYEGEIHSTYGAYQWTTGRNVRATLVFGKSHTGSIISSSDLDDIKIVVRNKNTHSIIASTPANSVQNVKIIQFTAPAAGYYFDIEGIKQHDNSIPLDFSLFWRGT